MENNRDDFVIAASICFLFGLYGVFRIYKKDDSKLITVIAFVFAVVCLAISFVGGHINEPPSNNPPVTEASLSNDPSATEAFPSVYPSTNEKDFQFNGMTGTILRYLGSDEEVTIPSEINYVPVKRIGNEAFENNKTIGTVKISYGVVSIGENAFSHTNLATIEILNSITNVEKYAVLGTKLTSIEIPNSVTSIGPSAFALTDIKSANIPNGIINIEDMLFYGTDLASIEIPNRVTYIGRMAFSGTNLTSVEIPNSVKNIEWEAFSNTKLSSIFIPDSVKKLVIMHLMDVQDLSFMDLRALMQKNMPIKEIMYLS